MKKFYLLLLFLSGLAINQTFANTVHIPHGAFKLDTNIPLGIAVSPSGSLPNGNLPLSHTTYSEQFHFPTSMYYATGGFTIGTNAPDPTLDSSDTESLVITMSLQNYVLTKTDGKVNIPLHVCVIKAYTPTSKTPICKDTSSSNMIANFSHSNPAQTFNTAAGLKKVLYFASDSTGNQDKMYFIAETYGTTYGHPLPAGNYSQSGMFIDFSLGA